MIDHALGGDDPFVYHLSSLIYYLILCLVLYRILLSHFKQSALWITLFFALHPIHTESVAWIAARNDILAGLFCLLSFFYYKKFDENKTIPIYMLSIFFWVLAFLSKPVAIVFPLIIVSYDLSVQSIPWKRNLTRWVPFFILSFIGFLLTVYIARHFDHIQGDPLPLLKRIQYTVLLIQRYLAVSFAPVQLSFYYNPFPDLSKLVFELVLSIALFVLLATLAGLWCFKDKNKFFILILFFAFLLPVLQIIPFPIMQADRYLFYSVLSVAIIMRKGIETLTKSRGKNSGIIVCIILALLYFGLSWQRIQKWEFSSSVWKDAASKSSNPFAEMQLGRAYFKEKQHEKALRQFLKVIDEKPDFSGGYYWAGRSMIEMGKEIDAEIYLKKAKQIENNSHTNYQLALIAYGREDLESVFRYLSQAVQIEPRFWEGYYLQGLTHLKAGDADLAFKNFCKSLHLSSKNYDDALNIIKQLDMGDCTKKITAQSGKLPQPKVIQHKVAEFAKKKLF